MTRKITFRSFLCKDGIIDRAEPAKAYAVPDTKEGSMAAAFLYWSSAKQDKKYSDLSRNITPIYVDIDIDTMEVEVRYAV